MQKELQLLEKKHCIDWREYRIGDIFEVRKGKRLPERVLEDTKGNIALINQSTQNNMVARYSGLQGENEIYVGNAITFGVNTKCFGYQTGQFYTIADVLFLKADFLNSRNANFIIPIISKALPPDGWDKIFGLVQMKDLVVKLPTSNNKIAFEYIEEFLATLDAERLATLDAYLTTTNLKDYTLTKEEKEALEKIESVKWGEFRIEDVLEWQQKISELNPLNLDKLSIDDDKLYPFYGQATINKGIIEYLHLKDEVLNNKSGKPTILIHSNNQNIIYLDTPFYLKDGHGATSVLQAKFLDRYTAFFLMSSIKKAIIDRFSYNAKATKINLKNTLIQLPVQPDNTPDFAFMTTYIKAMQKIVIKNVVEWADRRIEKTKLITTTTLEKFLKLFQS